MSITSKEKQNFTKEVHAQLTSLVKILFLHGCFNNFSEKAYFIFYGDRSHIWNDPVDS